MVDHVSPPKFIPAASFPMPIDWDDTRDRIQSFCTKFLSLIVGVLMAVGVFVYLIGVARYLAAHSGFERLEVPHFFGLAASLVSTVSYLILHCIPKKAYRLLYFVTVSLILSIVMSSHSMGVTGPTVDECDELPTNSLNFLGEQLQSASRNNTQTASLRIGALGQSLGACEDQAIIFSGCTILLLFQMIAIFDVQRLLLQRVRSKTYGERFYEMGIR